MNPLPYQQHGSGPPVVLLHAFPLSATMWKENAAALADAGYRAICPDFPGFGENAEFNQVSSMGSIADAVIDLLTGLELHAAAFAGLSMGGYVLLSILRCRPDLISCFALCDTTSKADTEEKRNGRVELISRLEKEGSQALVDAMLSNLLSPNTLIQHPEIVEQLRVRFLECDPDAAAAALLGMAERPDSLDVFRKARIPSILIFGEDDHITNVEGALEMKRVAFKSELAVIPNAGHYSNLESPKEFNNHLISFLNSHYLTSCNH